MLDYRLSLAALLGLVACTSAPVANLPNDGPRTTTYGVTATLGGRDVASEWEQADDWLWYGGEIYGVAGGAQAAGFGLEFGFHRTTSDDPVSTNSLSSRGTEFTEVYLGSRYEIPQRVGRVVVSAGVSRVEVVTNRPLIMGFLRRDEEESFGAYLRVGYAIPLWRGTELVVNVRGRVGDDVESSFDIDVPTGYFGGDIGFSFRF